MHERLEALSRAIAAGVAEADTEEAFPAAGFAELAAYGVVGDPPIGPGETGSLLRVLAAVGRGDLSTGRIFEGHVNAMILVDQHGTASQRSEWLAEARSGRLFGVWNTDMPDAPLRWEAGVLSGGKNFASGVDGLSRAIVTVPDEAGRLMLMVPLEGLPVDRSWWKPLGMRASGSHLVDFTGIEPAPDWFLGAPGVYVAEPWFGGGAIRFAAVHVGGMHAVFDVALEHLVRTGRAEDPYQAHRIARMGIAVETGYAWLDRAAEAWDEAVLAGGEGPAAARLTATANTTRSAVEAAAMTVLEEAERAVGAGGFIAPHRLERLVRDLRTYLRQPNPDGALRAAGVAVAKGEWQPGLAGPDKGRPA
ncbi:acyl-CoA dehydrogenase family protein [Aurantimonas endophytica]|uniref:Alkylation response protein AidB-like acyl-CoA dehydrogenase n=1 Tax=Aurantimonas endophytica TaxID=1522175 RepID=A0A7W6HFU7_9HYPH|nr:acyl-CoA dehydrogenase family protein [Aurantimonas endophytica]MBB4004357.1 alkylation response protein AidB-like acyl-CoA dehydrogenase [Aurantimonas endophytica]MCO6405196.1 acyl-CoA dehydrogenase [Aurantimonas endophytica]